jgi:hypothetical protein
MPGLAQSLEGHDLGHLLIVAQSWEIALQASSVREAIDQLIEPLLAKVANFENVSGEAKLALNELASNGGRLPWAQFTRKFGELREMGAARRDKEQPQRQPISTTETLWYYALIGRAFFDSPQGPLEFAYIPDEMLAVLPLGPAAENAALGRLARPEERAVIIPANDKIVGETCTLLAGLRLELNEDQLTAVEDWQTSPSILKALLKAARILDESGQPNPKATRVFLEAGRGQALAQLVQSWLQRKQFNELRLMPGLVTEGNWENDPLTTRNKVLDFARNAPAGQWWSISALIADVKVRHPDFQRPAGDYDSWYLRAAAGGEYLRGFKHWDAVDGALLAFLLRGPMHWLGLLDVASPAEGKPATAFRWSAWAKDLLARRVPKGLQVESLKLKVDSRGVVSVPRLAPRAARYQVARFASWLPVKAETYQYQLTARSLEAARRQGLKIQQLLNLLKAHSAAALPPNLLQALKRWEQHGSQARLSQILVLRVHSAAALKALRASRAARYLGEPLGSATISVKAGAGKQVLQALMELGYLGELEEEES